MEQKPTTHLAKMFLAIIAVNSANAATPVNITSSPGIVTQIKAMPSLLGLDKDYQFELTKEVTLPNGVIKAKFSQHYKKIPVWGYDFVASKSKNGRYKIESGRYLNEIDKDLAQVRPVLTKEEALTVLLSKKGLTQETNIINKHAELYIIADKNNSSTLVYMVSFVHENGNETTRPFAIINAISGELVKTWEGLTTRNATGPGGNLKTGKYTYGVDYDLLNVDNNCRMDTDNVSTYNMNHQRSGSGRIHQFTCPTNNYKEINGAYSPLNDAHFFGNLVFNLYKDWFNVAPLTMKLKLRVHFSRDFENAFWDGQQMTFGDGGNRMHPLVAVDVVAHEVSHGFTQQNSDLVYEQESGGMNEAFSDMSGQAAQYFLNKNKPNSEKNDWLVGGDIFKGQGEALRYFDDPTRDGHSIDHIRDYNDEIDVHNSSGIYNKAFYHLAHMANWNVEKSFRIFVLANQVYWHKNSTFAEGACQSAKAASDLGFSVADVREAFEIVGIELSNDCGGSGPDPDPNSDGQELELGRMIKGLHGEEGSENRFFINVPNDAFRVGIQIFGGIGNANLFVKYGDKATTESFDCAAKGKKNKGVCNLLARPGKYSILILGKSAYDGLDLYAQISHFKK
jgi:vibriolysin